MESRAWNVPRWNPASEEAARSAVKSSSSPSSSAGPASSRNSLARLVCGTRRGNGVSPPGSAVTTQGGPGNSTQVLSTIVYTRAFVLNDLGVASALSVLLVVLMMGTAVLVIRRSRTT